MKEKEPQIGLRDITSEPQQDKERLEVTVTLQPPEFFESNEGETLQVATTNNFEVVYRKNKDGVYEYVIYNEVGKSIKPSVKLPASNMNGPDFKVSADYHVYLDEQSQPNVVQHLKKFGIPDNRIPAIVKSLRAKFNNSYAFGRDFNKRRETLVAIDSDFKADADKNKFVFQVGDRLFIYKTISEDGRVLSPDEWDLIPIEDNSRITPQQLKEMPFLREFVATQKGRLLPNLDIAVNNENNLINVIDIKKNIRLYTDTSAGYSVDPNDGKTVYYVNPQQKELRFFKADEASPAQTPIESKQLPFSGTVKDFKFDPQGNFFLFLIEENGSSKLYVAEKDTLSISAEIPDVSGSLDMDNLGNIYFIDKDKKVRFATTNFMTFPKGGLEEARKQKREKLLKLKEKLATLDLTKVGKGERPISAEATEEEILKNLGKQLRDQLGPEIDKANTVEDLDNVSLQVEALKADQELGAHPEIFRFLEEEIQKKVNNIKTEGFRASLDEFKSLVESASSASEALDLESRYHQLLQERREVVITDPKLRKSLDEQLKQFEKQKDEKFAQFEGELISSIGTRFGEIQELVGEVGTPEELTALSGEKAVVDFERALTQLKDRKLAGEWRKRYKELVNTKKQELSEQIEGKKEAERTRLAQLLEESREVFEEIETTIDTEVTDTKELAKWVRGNPLITKYRSKLLGLPEDLRKSEEDKLDTLLKEKKRDFEHKAVLRMPKKGGEVNFGKEAFPVFEDIKVVWQPKVDPLSEGSDFGNLVFQDNLGRVFRPDIGSVPVNLDDPLTKEAVGLYKAKAEKYFESLKRKIPDYNDKWVMNDFNKEVLGDIAKLSKIQVKEYRGVLILEGEAGTGKNVMVDMFSHFTNRETFTFSCNFQSEKEDITYAFKFDPQRGTYQVDSRLLEMLQTPGAVIVLDEINTLPPGVGKMLNPLLDYRRTLFLPDGREIKADPTVLIIGTMNPQHYLGVKPLSQEVKSRARVLYVDYPPEKKGSKFTPYEGQILSKYSDALSGVNESEFNLMWDYVVNSDTANGGDKLLTDERREAIKKLHLIVKTANKIRDAYKAFRTGHSNDIIEFVFSLRESVDIASELNHEKDVKQAIKDVVLPKISDPSEKMRIQTIIENV